ncbi:MAG TPA: hypothetical protein VGS08_00210 [Candidatus Saccharimonadales bacterium]|nr:hypothetical protein [Candidatus Saccharimonadales bacterium]
MNYAKQQTTIGEVQLSRRAIRVAAVANAKAAIARQFPQLFTPKQAREHAPENP